MLSDLDLRDAHARRRLTVAAMPAVVLAPLELHDEDLAATSLAHDFAGHLRVAQAVRPGDQLAVPIDEQDRAKLDARALLAGKLLHGDHLPRRYTVLLPPGLDDGFHRPRPSSKIRDGKQLSDHSHARVVNSCSWGREPGSGRGWPALGACGAARPVLARGASSPQTAGAM